MMTSVPLEEPDLSFMTSVPLEEHDLSFPHHPVPPSPGELTSHHAIDSDGWRHWNSATSMGVAKTERALHIPYPNEDPPGGGIFSPTLNPFCFNPHPPAPLPNPVELQVSNLDQTIDQREMKKIITNIFRQHVMTLHVSVFFQTDGNMAACVRVASLSDAQLAISKLHRTKVGFKRILISYSHTQNQNPLLLRSKVFNLLSEVPGGRLQLFKFREMFERRFHASVGVSDLYKMKEFVLVTEEHATGRMVQLHPSLLAQQQQVQVQLQQVPSQQGGLNFCGGAKSQSFPSPSSSFDLLESSQCHRHAPKGATEKIGWAEKESGSSLPLVNVSLQVFGPVMRRVVKSHGGTVPLSTVVHCYEAEAKAAQGEQEDEDDAKVGDGGLGFGLDDAEEGEGVPMEHLISCIKGLQIQHGVTGTKSVVAIGSFDEETLNSSSSNSGSTTSLPSAVSGGGTHLQLATPLPPNASLAGQMALFSRELVDLLRSQSHCRMPFHKFIPSYHHFFGRQCRVADYGYTKLKDLFEALPHVVQILGEGSKAAITLTHRAQVKRFTSDILKVLKSQSAKQVSLMDLPIIYEKVTTRPFRITDYGVCEVEDLLLELSETSVVLSGTGDEMVISIPKREQTLDEVERTHQFAAECVELLRHAPDCRLPFNKFIPSYHHHFGRQCRVANYGFSKLIELFEAVPGTVEVTEDADGERLLQLTDAERMQVVGEHISSLIQLAPEKKVKLDDLVELYRSQYGYQLRPENLGHSTITGLLKNLGGLFRVDSSSSDGSANTAIVTLVDRSYVKALSEKVRSVLVEEVDGKMEDEAFKKKYAEAYGVPPDLGQLERDLPEIIEILEEEQEEGNKKKGEENTQANNNNNDAAPKIKVVGLVPLQLCVTRIDQLIKDYDGKLHCSELEAAFADRFRTPLCPGQFGYHSANTLIQQGLAKHFVIRGRGARKLIVPVKEGAIRESGGGPQGSATFSFPPPPSTTTMSSSFSSISVSSPSSSWLPRSSSAYCSFPRLQDDQRSCIHNQSSLYGRYTHASYVDPLATRQSFPYSYPYAGHRQAGAGFFQQSYSHQGGCQSAQSQYQSTFKQDVIRMMSSGLHSQSHSNHAVSYPSGGRQNQATSELYGRGGCHGGRSFFDSHALLQSGLGLYSRVPPPATTPNPVPRSGSSNGATGGASGSGSCANFGSFSQQHYLNDLAQFGIFPTRSQPANVPTSSASSRLSTSPALGSPISAPRSFSFGDGGGGDGGASQLQPALTSMDGGAVASAAAAAAAVLHQVNANAAVAAAAVDTAAVSPLFRPGVESSERSGGWKGENATERSKLDFLLSSQHFGL